MSDGGLIDVKNCYNNFWMSCLVNGDLKLLFYGGLKMLFWRFKIVISIKKPQQDLDLTVTYTFHTYIYRLFL